jgi:predicted transcriptional regulator
MVALNVALDPALHRRLALAALDERASMNELIREALRAYLDRRDAARARKGGPGAGAPSKGK